MYRKRNSGFSAITALALIVIMVGIIATGWFTYQNINKSSIVTPTPKTKPSTDTKTIPPADKFKVPELGIKLTLPNELSDLIYSVDNSASWGPVVLFNTTTLESMDGQNSQCITANGPIGSMFIMPEDPKTAGVPESASIKLTNGSYLVYQQPQSPCSGNESTGSFQLSQMKLMKEAISTAVLDK